MGKDRWSGCRGKGQKSPAVGRDYRINIFIQRTRPGMQFWGSSDQRSCPPVTNFAMSINLNKRLIPNIVYQILAQVHYSFIASLNISLLKFIHLVLSIRPILTLPDSLLLSNTLNLGVKLL